MVLAALDDSYPVTTGVLLFNFLKCIDLGFGRVPATGPYDEAVIWISGRRSASGGAEVPGL